MDREDENARYIDAEYVPKTARSRIQLYTVLRAGARWGAQKEDWRRERACNETSISQGGIVRSQIRTTQELYLLVILKGGNEGTRGSKRQLANIARILPIR